MLVLEFASQSGSHNEQVLMRGIADQVRARLARGGASAFSAQTLAMICWAYSKPKVMAMLEHLLPLSWASWTGSCRLPLNTSTVFMIC